ncbi:quinate 5-dehydrogenase QutB, putative [Talaromyces stipitatus ATCC 10500]|uniref:Quinate 5-dehydrogenase QutB, putative n=1 Tax=Talaromyces stipitatus (strain ATCC 10500 / CBS 375.48 / QM 6759 / NRRL 1006) TaxID=441959 RepID=B8MQY1_TALSN|nr:quinate 5-dehydrogenase QutB, putative [Talaromyces stipitatus ATCC 10500]EED12816.1 quinate 5-dehydrogenase QutB, putative [Talaromyces stipitatus ATCC 10500]
MTSDLAIALRESYEHGSSLFDDSATRDIETRIPLLGYPIHHSMAPLVHNYLFKSKNLPWQYYLLESEEPSDLLKVLDNSSEHCIGAAVTMPHKVTFMSHVDEITSSGKVIGAINTVFLRRDKATGKTRRIGTNTDTIGISRSFSTIAPSLTSPEAINRPALVVGGGGASRSAIYALHYLMVSRLKSETDELIAWFNRGASSTSGAQFKGKLRPLHSLEQATTLPAPYYVVSAIPDFPPQTDGERLSFAITRELLGRENALEKGVLLEMCYHPNIRTSLYDYAEKKGWHVIPGTEAMIWQALAQQVLWIEDELINEESIIEDLKRIVRDEISRRAANAEK